MQANHSIGIAYAQTKLKIRKDSPLGVFSIDKTDLRLSLNRRHRNFARIRVKTNNLVQFVRCNFSQSFHHSRGRVALVIKSLTPVIGLTWRPLVDGEDSGAQGVDQILLKTSAEMGTDLEVNVTRYPSPDRSLHRKPALSIQIG